MGSQAQDQGPARWLIEEWDQESSGLAQAFAVLEGPRRRVLRAAEASTADEAVACAARTHSKAGRWHLDVYELCEPTRVQVTVEDREPDVRVEHRPVPVSPDDEIASTAQPSASEFWARLAQLGVTSEANVEAQDDHLTLTATVDGQPVRAAVESGDRNALIDQVADQVAQRRAGWPAPVEDTGEGT